MCSDPKRNGCVWERSKQLLHCPPGKMKGAQRPEDMIIRHFHGAWKGTKRGRNLSPRTFFERFIWKWSFKAAETCVFGTQGQLLRRCSSSHRDQKSQRPHGFFHRSATAPNTSALPRLSFASKGVFHRCRTTKHVSPKGPCGSVVFLTL